MKFCMQCGHELGASRTCSSCGTTAPVEPPPAPQLPPAGARYPLFADEVDSVGVSTSGRVLTAPVPASAEPTQLRLPTVDVVSPRRGASAPIWLMLGALVIGALVLGGWLLLHGLSSPDSHKSGETPAAGAPSAGENVAGTATANAPVTRKPGVDTAGSQTSYAASNMLDKDPSTSWQMPGDGTDKELTFTLAGSTHLTEVGLINGYAKKAEQGGKTLDWYAGNRRILAVEWLFDDGTSVRQDLAETTNLQSKSVDVTTKTVRLRLLEVSDPGKGPAARNMTPISEVSLMGTPG